MQAELEIACFNLDSIDLAEKAGASRIEFCVDYPSGGTSPSRLMISEARKRCNVPLHVMIRPRPGDFTYTSEEAQAMKALITHCRSAAIDGVVLGALRSNNTINEEVCSDLLNAAFPMKVCFHRAIDLCAEPEKEIEKLVNLGFDYVLTSGGRSSASEGLQQLAGWQAKFGKQITVMPGGSVRSENIERLRSETGCRAFHSSAIVGNADVPDTKEIQNMRRKLGMK